MNRRGEIYRNPACIILFLFIFQNSSAQQNEQVGRSQSKIKKKINYRETYFVLLIHLHQLGEPEANIKSFVFFQPLIIENWSYPLYHRVTSHQYIYVQLKKKKMYVYVYIMDM